MRSEGLLRVACVVIVVVGIGIVVGDGRVGQLEGARRKAREWALELLGSRHVMVGDSLARGARPLAVDSVRAVRLRIENSNHAVYFVAGEWEPLEMNAEERGRLERDDTWLREACGEVSRFFAVPLREKGLGPDDVEVAFVCVNTLRFIPQSTIGGRGNTGMMFRHRGTRVTVDATVTARPTGWSGHRAFDSDAMPDADMRVEVGAFVFDCLMGVLGLDARGERALLGRAVESGGGSEVGAGARSAAGSSSSRVGLVRTVAARRLAARK